MGLCFIEHAGVLALDARKDYYYKVMRRKDESFMRTRAHQLVEAHI